MEDVYVDTTKIAQFYKINTIVPVSSASAVAMQWSSSCGVLNPVFPIEELSLSSSRLRAYTTFFFPF